MYIGANPLNTHVCKTCGQLLPHEKPEETIRSWNRYTVHLERQLFIIDTGPIQSPTRHTFKFTAGEILYLLALVRASGRIAAKHYILDYVHGAKPESDVPGVKIIDVKIFHLRAALGEHRVCIHTEWGRGYRLRPFNEEGVLLP